MYVKVHREQYNTFLKQKPHCVALLKCVRSKSCATDGDTDGAGIVDDGVEGTVDGV